MYERLKELFVEIQSRRRWVSGSDVYAVIQLRQEGIGRKYSEVDSRKLRLVNSVGELEVSIMVKR